MNPTHQPATQPFERLRELEKKATPAPWCADTLDYFLKDEAGNKIGQVFDNVDDGTRALDDEESENNFHLIAEMRNALPALLDSHAAQARRQTLAAWCCELLDQAAQTNNPKPSHEND